MKLLFLSLLDFKSIRESNIYTDLLRQFVKNGHKVYIISPVERRKKIKTTIIREENTVILKPRIGNIQKTNLIEKGITTVLIERIFLFYINKYFSKEHFDTVLYTTPPITLLRTVEYIKKRDSAKTYLMLKDIFPQNAVDIGLIRQNGFGGVLYRYFKRKEKLLYEISDRIGCMSQANLDYIKKYYSKTISDKVEICPNCIEVIDKCIDEKEQLKIRDRYGIPSDRTVFVYGGNLGKPQGIPFLIECLKTQEDNTKVFFLIIGDGTEYGKLENYIINRKPQNIKLLKLIAKDDYDNLIAACDVGLIFLDHRFTIPNFPSRLLGYMQAGLPVLACTDPNTDIGKIIKEGKFGWWCESNDAVQFKKIVDEINCCTIQTFSQNARSYLMDHYQAKDVYYTIQKT